MSALKNQFQRVRVVIHSLVQGVHPTSGKELPKDSIVNEIEVTRALGTAVLSIDQVSARWPATIIFAGNRRPTAGLGDRVRPPTSYQSHPRPTRSVSLTVCSTWSHQLANHRPHGLSRTTPDLQARSVGKLDLNPPRSV